MHINEYNVKILSINNHTDDTICLKIERPNNFDYIAGQFVQFHVPDSENKAGEVLRSYSISSTPADEKLEFCIKLVPNGKAGEYLKKAKVGDNLKFGGPLGRFINENKESPLHFVATGVGIAPIISIIKDELLNKDTKQKLHLLFGVRSENDIFYTELLDKLKEKYNNFDYQLTLSRPSDNWTGLKERVTSHIPEEVNKESHYYICGNIQMINDVKKILEERGLGKNNIHFEAL